MSTKKQGKGTKQEKIQFLPQTDRQRTSAGVELTFAAKNLEFFVLIRKGKDEVFCAPLRDC